jgi:hypothetical protein
MWQRFFCVNCIFLLLPKNNYCSNSSKFSFHVKRNSFWQFIRWMEKKLIKFISSRGLSCDFDFNFLFQTIERLFLMSIIKKTTIWRFLSTLISFFNKAQSLWKD